MPGKPAPIGQEYGRSRAPWLGRAHCCVAVLVDLDHEATRVVAAREASQPSRATEDDCVGVGSGLDREAFGNLLVKKRVESVLPCSHRVDVAHPSRSIDEPDDLRPRDAGSHVSRAPAGRLSEGVAY